MAHFDRVIPPGGEGKISLSIDTTRISGVFEKEVLIWTNDSQNISIALFLKGEVRQRISMKPGGFVSLWGKRGNVAPGFIEIINNTEEPFRIRSGKNDMPERITWRIEEVRTGYAYRLEVEDRGGPPGSYVAHLELETDLPEKPMLRVIVSGHVTD